MSGSLVKIQETIISSSTASVTLTGIDSTYDVYMVIFNTVVPVTNGVDLFCRVTESGTPNSTANYDYAVKLMRTSAGFLNIAGTNGTEFDLGNNIENTNGSTNGVMYIFNANNSSEYTFITTEFAEYNTGSELSSWTGGGVFTSASSVNGLHYFFDSSSNIASGTFTLYGLKK